MALPLLVSFLVVGAQKSGTSALAAHLMKHPDLFLPSNEMVTDGRIKEGRAPGNSNTADGSDRVHKELHFFDQDSPFLGSTSDLSEYHRYFSGAPDESLWGEVSPTYMYFPKCAKRMRQYNPALKLIMTLRNPIERAYSHWSMQRHRGIEKLEFAEALRAELTRLSSLKDPNSAKQFAYIDRGRYARQIKNLQDHFPPQQMLIVKSEWLRGAHVETLSRISAFLNINDFERAPTAPAIFKGSYSPMQAADRAMLVDLFHQEIVELGSLLGWDCTDWLSTPDTSGQFHKQA